jgi:hypothetical protein
MIKLATTVFCTLSLAAGVASAASHMEKKADTAMAKDTMTMQQCKDHMAMAKKDGKKDDAMMKKDATCADMMKKDGGAMKKDAAAPAPKK